MGNQIIPAPEAEQDLDEIVAYIAKDNPASAEKFGIHLIERIELLKSFPTTAFRVDIRATEHPVANVFKWNFRVRTEEQLGIGIGIHRTALPRDLEQQSVVSTAKRRRAAASEIEFLDQGVGSTHAHQRRPRFITRISLQEIAGKRLPVPYGIFTTSNGTSISFPA